MPTEHRIHVRYTEPVLRRAVRMFLWRRLLRRGWLWGLTVSLLLASLAFGWSDGASFGTGVAAASLLFVVVGIVAVWRAHLSNTLGRFRAMNPPEADIMFEDAGMTVVSSLGSGTLRWSSFTEWWELPGFWMLFQASSQFTTLPLETIPPETLAYLRSKLPAQ